MIDEIKCNDCYDNESKNITIVDQFHFLDELEATIQKQSTDKVFVTWYDKNLKPTSKYTFHQLWDEAHFIANDLRTNYNLQKGDRVILCYNFGLQFFAAFFGCLRAGLVAVPIYPPNPSKMALALTKMNNIIADSAAKLVMIDETINFMRLTSALSTNRGTWPKDVEYKTHPRFITLLKAKKIDK